jgi:hypothetical protein
LIGAVHELRDCVDIEASNLSQQLSVRQIVATEIDLDWARDPLAVQASPTN